jgi:diguanylate cyclase (GGDEF)-like protein
MRKCTTFDLTRLPAAMLLAALCSLGPQLPAHAQDDARTLIDRAAIALRTDPEATRRLAEAALVRLRAAPDADLEIRARLLLCEYHSERSRSAAEREVGLADALLPRAQRRGLRAGVLGCQGEILETAGDNAQARKLYEQAVTVATVAEDEEMLAGALFQRGFMLGLQGEYAAGLADLRQAEQLYERVDMPHHSLTALNGIASLYNRMGDYSQARDMYARALDAQRKAGMRREQAVTLHNLGRAHERLGDWAAAREAFAASLAVSRELGYTRGEAYALRGLAAVANASGDPQGALETLARATKLQGETPDVRLRGQIELARGAALRRLQRLPESVAALQIARKIFADGNTLEELGQSHEALASAHAELGEWRDSFEHEREAKAITVQLLRNQLDQRFALLKVEFDTATKDRQNELLRRENAANAQALGQARQVRRLQWTVIGLTAVLALLLGWLAIQLRRSNLRMRSLAMTDELTSVPNRRAVLGRLEEALAEPRPRALSMLIIDIDHFKSINDQHGHPAGDAVLKHVADQIRAAVVEPAFFGRLGGEEFVIVLPETSLEAARQTAERFRELIMFIDTTRVLPDRRRITASVGVTCSIPGKDTASTMLQRADAALYVAKRSGRNCVRTEPVVSPVPMAAQAAESR